eukprot:TRINITY_DN13266_c0_g1_i4.p1 TRINITY_DN13266_c0_g1~~TRINITY_DN13266_c0_g1_i4.p1  ORF type:complete len:448 (-),score=61.98 TRINITY_DN13266_c0_g1_i4:386-1696(-)
MATPPAPHRTTPAPWLPSPMPPPPIPGRGMSPSMLGSMRFPMMPALGGAAIPLPPSSQQRAVPTAPPVPVSIIPPQAPPSHPLPLPLAGPSGSSAPITLSTNALLAPRRVPNLNKPAVTIGIKVLVSCIPSSVDDKFLSVLFEQCGNLLEWNRMEDPITKKQVSFGFCRYDNPAGALTAIKLLDGIELDGGKILVRADKATRETLEKFVVDLKDPLSKVLQTDRSASAVLDEEDDMKKLVIKKLLVDRSSKRNEDGGKSSLLSGPGHVSSRDRSRDPPRSSSRHKDEDRRHRSRDTGRERSRDSKESKRPRDHSEEEGSYSSDEDRSSRHHHRSSSRYHKSDRSSQSSRDRDKRDSERRRSGSKDLGEKHRDDSESHKREFAVKSKKRPSVSVLSEEPTKRPHVDDGGSPKSVLSRTIDWNVVSSFALRIVSLMEY